MSTVDWVILIISVGALAIGLLSMLVGQAVAWWDGVKSSVGARHGTAVMSSAAHAPIATPAPVPGSGPVPKDRRSPVPVPRNNLTEREEIIFLASLKDGDKWRHSGKKIYAFVGGNHDELLAIVREVRGDGDPADAPDDLVLTPIAGRATRESYYPNEPELEYRAP